MKKQSRKPSVNKSIIQIGDTFRTIKDTMQKLGRNTGNGIKPCYYYFKSPDIAVWFPVGAHSNKGVLERPAKNNWLNILSKDEKELTEILLVPKKANPNNKTNLPCNRRAVFLKKDYRKQEYTYIGVFTRIEGTKDDTVRLYRRTSADLDISIFKGYKQITISDDYTTDED